MDEIREIKEIVEVIEGKLPSEVSPSLKQADNQIPLKVSSIRGALIHRVYELSSIATSQYEAHSFIPAVITTRAVFETMALIYVLHKKIDRALTDRSTENLESFLERVILGSRNSDTEISAYNILNSLDEVSKKYEPCRDFYDQLSEFSHPNFAGVQASYSFMSDDKTILKLGPNPRNELSLGYIPLKVSLMISNHYYDELLKLESGLLELCGVEL